MEENTDDIDNEPMDIDESDEEDTLRIMNTLNETDSESSTDDEASSEANEDTDTDTSSVNLDPTSYKHSKVEIFTEDNGPKWYPVTGEIVTPVLISENIPHAFKFMPIHDKPKSKKDLESFQRNKVREFVGFDLNDEDFNQLAEFCSPNHLKTGTELIMNTKYPTHGPIPDKNVKDVQKSEIADDLCILKQLKHRLENDTGKHYSRELKYRGVRCFPPFNEDDTDTDTDEPTLEPGKDLIFRVRVYRPFFCSGKERNNTRHSIFSHDIVLFGRQKLTVLRDRIVCANDVGTRVDVSENPDDVPPTSAKEMFPSGFLFVNNVFYVDGRAGCKDNSRVIREWAERRRLGAFERRELDVPLQQVRVRLGHPEVYVHQGGCEHLFTFSEVRVASAADPRPERAYPHHSQISQNQTVYCTSCAEFGARWIVTGCARVPFDPAFFCDTCLRLYLYKDGAKVCDFKAYLYRGNEINVLKPPG